ncbi:flagellar M-ring protein [Agaricicola taiwanensis]|uniref:Flagellar M-ring protein n=1 Tax=Agaricicola taiwanensis TaxID=591372 RepID=A0A8J2VU93_9RHOB|nr:flagellar basal-body MS-ring/collar protein FliF [Agaricicola taiwanensis]GGE39713.1 flagellar M-ring protein [Agaricicola taiwanensis]
MGGFVNFFRTLGTARLMAMAVVTLALVGFFAFVTLRLTTPTMAPLFTDLTIKDSAAVTRELDAQGIVYETRLDGATIMVPREDIARARMRLAESGLPAGGNVGYEIFDKGDSLSATSFLQNVNKLRAMEGELARSISSLNRVSAARVHLVMPDRPLFRRDAPEPSASIVLRVQGELGAEQIRAVRHLVASAVPGLKTERISIVDESGRLLASGDGQTDPLMNGSTDERVVAVETRLKRQIEGILESVVGPGRGRAEVRAELDLSRVTQTSDNFDPESRVARSTQTREETNQSLEQNEGVTVANELPNADATGPNQPANQENSTKTEEVTNYEISRTTRTQVQEPGSVKRISVAVLVDGIYGTGPEGAVTYTPRTQEELDRIASLVRSAMGYDQQRGDQLEVVNLRFAEGPSNDLTIEPQSQWPFGLTTDNIIRAAETLVLLLVCLIVIFAVVRPLMRRMFAPTELPKPEGQSYLPSPLPMAGAGEAPTAAADEGALSAPPSNASRMVEMAQVNGKVRAQTLEQVGKLAEENPQETVAIIRQWLSEPA